MANVWVVAVVALAVAAVALCGSGVAGQHVWFQQTARPIRVALFRPLCEFGQTIDDLLAQLQADTYYDFDVQWVDDADLATLAQVQAFDVVCLFSSGNFPGDQDKIDDLTLNNVRQFVAGGGGLVTSWDFATALTQVSKIDAIKDAVPVTVGTSSGYVDHNPRPDFTVTNQEHPVMRNVERLWTTVVRCGYLPGYNASAELLMTVAGSAVPPLPGFDDKAVFAQNFGAGRVVWICLPYCGFFLNQVQNTRFGNPDVMLQNSLFWTSQVPLLCPDVDCQNGGTCVGPNNCSCQSGYTGVNCTEADCSAIGGCQNGGTCLVGGVCQCVNGSGFGGIDCSIANCANCIYGSCSTPNNCTCDPGYNGTSCLIPICYEGAGGCLNLGICEGPDDCRCQTQAAYEGPQCETFVPTRGCQGAQACLNGGVCVESATSVTGECNCTGTSHTGSLCQTPAYSCSPACAHGVCELVGAGPATECDCSNSGYNGTACDNPICNDPCHPIRGSCISPNYCDCVSGFTGSTCDRLLSPPNCANGGFLDDVSCNCSTAPGWEGPVCNTPICNPGCGVNGTCIGPDTCLCEQGWQGPVCDIPECLPACRNNGTCVAPPSECDCSTGDPCFQGFLCAILNTSLPGCNRNPPSSGSSTSPAPSPPPPGPPTTTGNIFEATGSGATQLSEQELILYGLIAAGAVCLCLCLGFCCSVACDKRKKAPREDWEY